jgi:transcriptional regulator with XRE-family HTH domain
MEIGQKLRELREEKHLSQGDIQHKTGLLRCYTSRVENGYTVPSIETLEKFARALEIPLYRFFTDGEKVKIVKLPTTNADSKWGVDVAHRSEIRLFARACSGIDDRNQGLLLNLAQKMARRHSKVYQATQRRTPH